MTDCIFCKIISGEIPCAKVYENDKVIAFLDIAPVNPSHTLIVPKQHYEQMQDIPDDMLCEVMITIKKLSKAIMKAVNTSSFNLGMNNGREAGQLIPHAHFHIMPRFAGDGYKHWQGKSYKEDEMQKIAENIRKAL